MATDTASVRLLFVCTGNLCRSAAADRIMTSWATGLRQSVAVRSAGTHAPVGRPVHDRTQRALQPHGIPVGSFSSRRLGEEDIDWADLVITMTARHREDVLAVSPRGMPKSFTLLEAAALCAALAPDWWGPGSGRAGEALAGAMRDTRLRYARAQGPDYDITDPIDGSQELHFDVVDQIVAALEVIASVLDTPGVSDHTAPMRRLPPVPRSS